MTKYWRFIRAALLSIFWVIAFHFPSSGCSFSHPALINVATIGRGQQAYFLEQGEFASTIPALGLGIGLNALNDNSFTENSIHYTMQVKDGVVFTRSDYETPVEQCASYLSDYLPFLLWLTRDSCPPRGWGCLQSEKVAGYTGITYITTAQSGETLTQSEICLNNTAENQATFNDQLGVLDCGSQGRLQ